MLTNLIPTLTDLAHAAGWITLVLLIAAFLGALVAALNYIVDPLMDEIASRQDLEQRQASRPVLHMAARKEHAR